MWVVLVDGISVQEQGYESEQMANLRIRHLREMDGVTATKWPVRVNSMPAPIPFDYPPSVVRTSGRGQELHDYGASAKFSLGEQVLRTWTAWLSGQAASGNLDEAGLEPPAELPELFEMHGGQLKLHPQGLP